MTPGEPTSDLVGRDVYASTGQRLGRVDSVYLDVEMSPVFAVLATTRRGRRQLMYVPLDGASFDPSSVRLRCGDDLARRAPRTKRDGVVTAELEADLYDHYELPYQPCEDAAGGRRRVRKANPQR